MLKKIFSFLSGAPVEKVAEYFVERQQLKQDLKLANLKGKQDFAKAKWEAKAAKEKAKVAQQQHYSSWEMASLAKHSGYKDDVVMFVILFPYVGCFIPVVQDSILIGFEYLAKMPYWAVGLTVTICLAIYGIRHKNASRIQAPGLRDKDVEPEK